MRTPHSSLTRIVYLSLLIQCISGFSLTKVSEIKVSSPAFTSFAKDIQQTPASQNRVLLTTFGMLSKDSLYEISFPTGQNLNQATLQKFNNDSVWPNQADFYEQYGLIVEAGGFFPNPSKATGEINLYKVEKDGTISTKKKISKDKKNYFYHRAILVDINEDGLPDILAARATKPVLSTAQGELIWLENKGGDSLDFEEHFIVGGPDVNFIFEDINGDGKKEVIATQYFTKPQVVMYSCSTKNWSLCNTSNIIQTVIDDTIEPTFDLQLTSLNGNGLLQLLVTNNNSKGTGQVFIYEIPQGDILKQKFVRHAVGSTYTPSKAYLPGRGAPGSARAFSIDGSNLSQKYIIVSGDDAGVVRLLSPINGQQFQYKETIICQSKNNDTIGAVSVGDFNQDGNLDLAIPFYSEGKVEFWSFSQDQVEFQ